MLPPFPVFARGKERFDDDGRRITPRLITGNGDESQPFHNVPNVTHEKT